MFGGDSLTFTATKAAFSDKNAGIGKTVNVSGIALGGADAGNYTLFSDTASGTWRYHAEGDDHGHERLCCWQQGL